MNTEEFLIFIKKYVPTFNNPRIVGKGFAFHYTNHYELIEANKKLKGHPINQNIDKTQVTIPSKLATDENGVVFAYQDIEDAKEEGFGCDIIRIEYNSAIIATH